MRWIARKIRNGRGWASGAACRAAEMAIAFLPRMTTIAGLGLVAWGLGMIYRPLAPVFIGGALLLESLTTQSDRDDGPEN